MIRSGGGGGGGGYSTNVYTGGRRPESNLLPFYIPFFVIKKDNKNLSNASRVVVVVSQIDYKTSKNRTKTTLADLLSLLKVFIRATQRDYNIFKAFNKSFELLYHPTVT